MKVEIVALDAITADAQIQPRELLDEGTLTAYTEAWQRLAQFPPLTVFHDSDDRLLLADGYHRLEAAKRAGIQSIRVEWREGDLNAAKLFAASANVAHGLPRSDGDKKRQIELVRSTPDGFRWTQERIARHVGVSQQYVSRV